MITVYTNKTKSFGDIHEKKNEHFNQKSEKPANKVKRTEKQNTLSI